MMKAALKHLPALARGSKKVCIEQACCFGSPVSSIRCVFMDDYFLPIFAGTYKNHHP